MKTVSLHTLGCKVNFAETSTIGRQFKNHGYEIVNYQDQPDIFFLNTCTVTKNAERECRQMIRRVLRKSPETFVIVAGCYAQFQVEEVKQIAGIDIILGTKEKFHVFDYLDDFRKKDKPTVFVSPIDEYEGFDESYSSEFGSRTRAFVKIQDGCDYNCAFCVIPKARGQSRSISINNLLSQINYLTEIGYKEIVLTGVNVGDYGRKIDSSLLNLLNELNKISGVKRIRISSIEPNLLSKDLVDFILDNEKFCNHFHIPLQSGNDTMLRLMKRQYLINDCKTLIEYIKMKDSSVSLGLDVIVGFPGETEQLFKETYKFLVELPFSYLHVFTYSQRPQTVASKYPNFVDLATRKRRNEILRNLGIEKQHAFYLSQIGRTLPVLFERSIKNDRITGLTTNYIRVQTIAKSELVNNIKNVKLVKLENGGCYGEIES